MALNRACTFPRYIVFFNKPPWVIIDTLPRLDSLSLYLSVIYIYIFLRFFFPAPFLEFIFFSPVTTTTTTAIHPLTRDRCSLCSLDGNEY